MGPDDGNESAGTALHDEASQYLGLFSGISAEEKASAKLSSHMCDLQNQLDEMLNRKVPVKDLPETPRTPQRSASKGAIKEKPRWRACACGCGAVRRCTSEEEMSPCSVSALESEQELKQFKADPRTQQASCVRLHQRKQRPAAVEEFVKQGARRPVNESYLNQLAVPRPDYAKKAAEDPISLLQFASSSAPSMKKSRSVPSWGPPPKLPAQAVGSNVSSPKASGSTTSSPKRPRVAPRRCFSKPARPYDSEELPGLNALRDRAELATLKLSLNEAGAALSFISGPTNRMFAEEKPRTKIRSLSSQKSYTEERLYRKPPAEPPGSVAALQKKLETLKQERYLREQQERAQREAVGSELVF